MGFAEERQMAEEALTDYDLKKVAKKPFPPTARRFLHAREALGITRDEVKRRGGVHPGDLEYHNDEAFICESVQDMATLAFTLNTSLMVLLFGEAPSPPLSPTSYPEIVARLHALMTEQGISVAQLSDKVGWELQPYLDAPDKLRELPIFGLRWICREVGIDWVTTLANVTAV